MSWGNQGTPTVGRLAARSERRKDQGTSEAGTISLAEGDKIVMKCGEQFSIPLSVPAKKVRHMVDWTTIMFLRTVPYNTYLTIACLISPDLTVL
jgi:hypothetical protein